MTKLKRHIITLTIALGATIAAKVYFTRLVTQTPQAEPDVAPAGEASASAEVNLPDLPAQSETPR